MPTRHVEKSHLFPVTVEQAYEVALTRPLPEIFGRRYGAIAPIRDVEGQDGAWGVAVGQTRTICLTDGGTMRETLTLLDEPHAFGYTISHITGMLKPLVSGAAGRWSFDPAGTGVRVTWAWDLEPTAALGRVAMPVFARLWSGYARQAMEQLEQLLVP